MFENFDISFANSQIHGADNSLKLLKEDDVKLLMLVEIPSSHFVITKRWDVNVGAHIESLTIRLDSDAYAVAYKKADMCELRVGDNKTRYTFEAKNDNVVDPINFGFADIRQTRNERTVIEE